MRRPALVAALTLAGAMTAGLARAEEPAPLDARLERAGELVTARFAVTPALTERFRRRVAGGLESRVEIETRLLGAKREVVGRGRRSCKLLYSLWDERVYLSVEDEGRREPRILTFLEVAPALDACTEARALPVALSGALDSDETYRLEVRVALNPVSEELVERSRQFITNPRGGAQGRPNAVLGAVAGLFGSEGGVLGETFDFRSRPLSSPRSEGRVSLQETETPTRSEDQGGER